MSANNTNHNIQMNELFNKAVKAELSEHGSNVTPIMINVEEVKALDTVEEFKDYLRDKSPEAFNEVEQAYGERLDVKARSLLDKADNGVMGAEVDFKTENFAVITGVGEDGDSKIEILTGTAGVPKGMPFYPENAVGDDAAYVEGVAVHETGHVLDNNIDSTSLNSGRIPYLSPDYITLMESERRGDHAIHVDNPQIGTAFEQARALNGLFNKFDTHNVAGVSSGDVEVTAEIKSEAYSTPMIMRYLSGMSDEEMMDSLKNDPQSFVDAVRENMEGQTFKETMLNRIEITLDAIETYMIPKDTTPAKESNNELTQASDTADLSNFDFSRDGSEVSTNDPSITDDLINNGVDIQNTPTGEPLHKPIVSLENTGALTP